MRFHSDDRHEDCCCCLHRLHRTPRENNRIEHEYVRMSECEARQREKRIKKEERTERKRNIWLVPMKLFYCGWRALDVLK